MEKLIERINKAQSKDQEIKESLILENMGLVYHVCNHIMKTNQDPDCIQVGCIGLIKAIERFDVHYNVKFSTYAVACIIGEIKRYYRDQGQIHVARKIKENALLILKEQERFQQHHMKEPTMMELEKLTHLEREDFILAFEKMSSCLSLDYTFDEDESSRELLQCLTSKKEKDIPLMVSLKNEIKNLSQKEQLLLYYRYDKQLNQTQVSKLLGCSQVQVSRIEKRIYEKLKERLL